MSDPPSAPAAERALIGSVLINPTILAEARWLLSASDFYRPTHQMIWGAMTDLYGRGRPIDQVTVSAELRTADDVPTVLHDALNATPASSRWAHYSEEIIRASTARQLIFVASSAAAEAFDHPDPWKVAANLSSELTNLGRASGIVPPDVYPDHEYADMPDDVLPEWLVPGWLRVGDRAIVVATEGIGKSVLTLQWAAMVANGVNPMWPPERHAPCTCLVIDLENPGHELRRRTRLMRDRLERVRAYVPGLYEIWHRPGGIDLRARATAREFDALLTDLQPSLVVLSPLYKSFRRQRGEDHEEVAAEMQAIFDDLRSRFGFALVIEHHAPKGGNGLRDMIPFGSSLWQRWPEYGIALAREKDNTAEARVGRYREDRVKNNGWPSHLKWGQDWPWEATYRTHPSPWAPGTPRDYSEF